MSLDLLREAAGWLLIAGGGLFMIVGGLGLLRMPDVFTRLHAASVSDTFGASLVLLGLMVQAGFTLVSAKLLFLFLFLLFSAPIATHALARAALAAGIKPVLAPDSPETPQADAAAPIEEARRP